MKFIDWRGLSLFLALGLCANSQVLVDSDIVNPVSETQDPITAKVRSKVALNWNESGKAFRVTMENSSDMPLDIIGVQGSGGLFIAKVPDKIPAKGKAKIVVIYRAREGASGGPEFINVLTANGIRTIEINLAREAVVSYSAEKLTWAVAEATEPKEFEITVTRPDIKVSGVRVPDGFATAKLTDLRNGKYKVIVTPMASRPRDHFPLFIDFNPRVPDVVTVIRCEIEKR
ncbi:hypothetical protein [Nibricoccus sp. IMCC34717]|uniref:hypothetical protein n=1 Tax=Nibricoccus sp. IMCC34717 TaxID=3034021 RepID=UPI00384FB213